MENLVNFFINAFSGLDKNVVVFLISMFPLLELRGVVSSIWKFFRQRPLHFFFPPKI